MTMFPFTIVVNPISGADKPQQIQCLAQLRIIEGKRMVYDGLWGQKSVIAKVFTGPIKARYHFQKEWSGLQQLSRRGLSIPKPLFCGKTEKKQWVIVTENIGEATTAAELWDIFDTNQRQDLLVGISRELADHHKAGVLQKDLHLGNFLVQGKKVFALDPAQMRFFEHEIEKNKSISQLALLTCFVPDNDTIDIIAREYAEQRSCEFSESDTLLLKKKLSLWRKKGIRHAVKKTLRTSKRFQAFKIDAFRGVATKEFFEQADLKPNVSRLDELMRNGRILKDGNTCHVSRITLEGRDIVVKRYNHKGIVHSLRHTIKSSRARKCWLNAHRLIMLDIATPAPLAFVEQQKGPVIWKSYIITRFIEAAKLHDILNDDTSTKDQQQAAIEQMKNLLDKLSKHKIIHGDLKHSNILITPDGPILTDLDSMKVYSTRILFNAFHAKDVLRLKIMQQT
ncbi:MAG: lipopolysaccharide kinase InaA family protein [Planctomycetota bacterium]|jgi:tRNA A-37 threonylcarbamoyl transferase component Bud32